MDIEFNNVVYPLKSLKTPADKSSRQQRFEFEVHPYVKELGTLSDIQKRLGLSGAAMAEFLMVDPSTYSRWISGETRVPPFVYKALIWYFESNNDNTELISKKAYDSIQRNKILGLEKKLNQFESQYQTSRLDDSLFKKFKSQWLLEKEALLRDFSQREQVSLGWKLVLIINTVLVLFFLFF